MDHTDADILKILKRLSLSHQIHYQWIPSHIFILTNVWRSIAKLGSYAKKKSTLTHSPSHVDIAGNEIADSLARAGAGETTTPAAPLIWRPWVA
ncbi:hypothetical protein TNCV_2264511 [Trichonephila clavipes]|nr:hypothetical protein TNCV_2264511 [Trichonephila clavipes]